MQTYGMEKMTDHKNIYAALASAQMQMGKAIKDSANPAFKSKYADLASVMEACMGALNANGIAVYQPTVDDEGGRYVKTILAHTSGETLECRVPLIIQKNDMQGYGSAVTYARRYGLMGMAGIAPEDDDGNAAAKAAPVTEERPGKPKADIAKAIGEACAYLSSAADLPDLQARWNNLPTAVKADPRVIEAKDAAKVALQAPPANADLDDEITY
jgi:hypothetical protein